MTISSAPSALRARAPLRLCPTMITMLLARHARMFHVVALAVSLGLFLGGCAVGPDFAQPAAPDVSGHTAGRLPSTDAAAVSRRSYARLPSGPGVSVGWVRPIR